MPDPAAETAVQGEVSPPPASPGRRIEYVPLPELVPNPRNPKAHDLSVLDTSVGRFGFIEPVVRDERTGLLVSGHGRAETLLLMRARGENPPDGVRVDSEGDWQIPVVVGWASRSDTEASAALVTLNRATELGGWVDDELLALLDELTAADADHGLDGVGFDDASITALRERLEALAAAGFLDDLADGDAHNPFRDGDGLDRSDEVEVRFVMSPEERSSLMARLRSHRHEHPAELQDATYSYVLLDLLSALPASTPAA